jgi:transcriptional regulator with XRE-family HTH domain
MVSGATIGERIATRLDQLGWSQAELARRLGIERKGTVGDWIRGRQDPSADYLRRLSVVLEMTLEELLGVADGQDPPFAAWAVFLETPEGLSVTPDERRALASFMWPSEPTATQYAMLLGVVRMGPPRGSA